MFDPYVKPRVQRQVPWRERTVDGMAIVMEAADRRLQAIAITAYRALATMILQRRAARSAAASGALPGDFLMSELRTDFE